MCSAIPDAHIFALCKVLFQVSYMRPELSKEEIQGMLIDILCIEIKRLNEDNIKYKHTLHGLENGYLREKTRRQEVEDNLDAVFSERRAHVEGLCCFAVKLKEAFCSTDVYSADRIRNMIDYVLANELREGNE